MTDDEIIAVVSAHKEGKKIQYHCKGSPPEMWDITPDNFSWNFGFADYRVVPEEHKPREWSVVLNRESDIIAVAIYREGHEVIRVREILE